MTIETLFTTVDVLAGTVSSDDVLRTTAVLTIESVLTTDTVLTTEGALLTGTAIATVAVGGVDDFAMVGWVDVEMT